MAYMVLQPILALIAGVLILIFPRFLNYFIPIFLIIYGITGLIHRLCWLTPMEDITGEGCEANCHRYD